MAANPHHPGGAPMRLYRSARIEEVEATEVFQQARTIAEQRQAAARKGLQTKAANVAASAAENIPAPVLPPAPREELLTAAITWFSRVETWRTGAGRWISPADPDETLFPIVVDFIRDRLRDYRNRARPIGLPVEQGAAAVDRKIIEAIALAYTWVNIRPENESSSGQGGEN